MNNSPIQFIEHDGKRVFAVVPMAIFERMAQAAEEAEDIAALRAFESADDGFRIPGTVLDRQLETGSAVLAWREDRALTQDQLAAQAGISKPYLSQIETGKRAGTAATLRKLATALQVPMDVLTG